MEFLQLLDAAKCTNEELITILGVVRFAINIITFVIPIILIVLGIMDLAKAVTSQKEDDMKKAQKTFLNRAIYAVVIFLVPTIVTLLFDMLPGGVFGSEVNGFTWKDCWDAAK